ncbi:MAG TPA: gamma carbonic anhydrase family protein [Polyangia bacterium]|nr:gamma carbonic anhydrase family protein [Polyangia bacterium]
MAMISTSVTALTEPLPDARELDARVAALRARFPRAILDRYLRALPELGGRVVLFPGAAVVGDVALGEDVSIWYGAVLRGDLAPVRVGARSNIQDGSVLHVADGGPCEVGEDTVVGHRAMLHACRVEDGCLIGMQATILDGAVIGHGSVVGAGALVTQRSIIPPRSLVLGAPARVVRGLEDKDEAFHRAMAAKYVRLKENYRCDSLRRDLGE